MLETKNYKFREFSVHPTNYCMYKNGDYFNIPETLYQVLRILLENKGRAVSKNIILSDALGVGYNVYSRRVDMYISRLRKLLNDNDKSLIKTIKGVGYVIQ